MDKGTVISIHLDDGIRTGLVVAVGPKWMSVIWPDSSGMKIHKVKQSVARYHVYEDYPVKRARKLLRRAGTNFGITKAARRALAG
jgi:hypothetical protein